MTMGVGPEVEKICILHFFAAEVAVQCALAPTACAWPASAHQLFPSGPGSQQNPQI